MAGHRPVNPDPNFRRCPRCRAVKPITDYHRNRTAPDGRNAYCKPCQYARLHERPPSKTTAERFWPRVDKNGPNGCWIWTGAKNTRGYGQVWIGGKERLILAHRLSLILSGREVPPPGRDIKNGVIDHICKVHACVNPEHLRVVTQRFNSIENGLSPFAINAKKTHCKYGHEFTPENTRIVKSKGGSGSITTGRVCLKCYGPGGERKVRR